MKVDVQQIKQRFGIIGNNPGLNRAIDVALQVAPTDLSVLITGESGVGKETFPQIIHQNSQRKHGQYIAVNCGAIPEGTIDSELFGHEKGSFTGALADRKGYFEVADGGTIFLDEVGELPTPTQARLLRVLETGEFIKVGSSKVQKTNVRIVAATNVNLVQAVSEGKFREDLYYRLSVVPIELKPLRERREDIPVLARHFCELYRRKYGKETELSPNAVAELAKYDWPGNIRELENLVERLVVTDSVGEIGGCQVASALNFSGTAVPEAGPLRASLKTQLQTFERELILGALERTGSLRKAAASLGVEHSTLVKKCKRLGISSAKR